MLFLLKRTWLGSLLALAVLAGLAWPLRLLLGNGPAIAITFQAFFLGLGIFAGVLISDGLVHLALWSTLGEWYPRRYDELAGVFQTQRWSAILAGALLAGIGEELLFRGSSSNAMVLGGFAVAFGLLHHIRLSLWLFTLWSIYEGFLLAIAVYLTGNLFVTMVAHFLHDLTGLVIFRFWRKRFPTAS